MQLLRRFPEDIAWSAISSNPSPAAFTLMSDFPEKIVWNYALQNPNPEMHTLIMANIHTIKKNHRCIIAMSPHIFEEGYNYAAMRIAMDVLREDLTKAAFHPRRLARHLEMGGDPEEF
jgi:hypothetical protein